MGFREKSAWACLMGIALVFIPYFVVVFRYPMAFVGLFVLTVIVQVIFMTVFHVVNAIMSNSIRKTGDSPPRDELDRMVELHAAKFSGVVLGVTVIAWCLIAMYGAPTMAAQEIVPDDGAELSTTQFAIPVVNVLLAVHMLFAGFVMTNLIYYGSIVVSYRRLASG